MNEWAKSVDVWENVRINEYNGMCDEWNEMNKENVWKNRWEVIKRVMRKESERIKCEIEE